MRNKKTLLGFSALVIALGAFFAAASDIASFWETYVVGLFDDSTRIEVVFEGNASQNLIVALQDSDESSRIIETVSLGSGEKHSFSTSNRTSYRLIWQGQGIKPAIAENILSARGIQTIAMKAVPAPNVEEYQSFIQVEIGPNRQIFERTQSANANQLIAAARTELNGTFFENASAVSRANSVVGLLEYGNLQCERTVVVSKFGASFGCLALPLWSIGNRLPQSGENPWPVLLDTLYQKADLDMAVRVLNRRQMDFVNKSAVIDENYLRIVKDLANTQDVWVAHDKIGLDYYANSLLLAREKGFTSERAVLAVYLSSIQHGPSLTRRLLRDFIPSDITAYSDLGEAEKLNLFVDHLNTATKKQFPAFPSAYWDVRASLVKTGTLERRGVVYDLDAIGITLGAQKSDMAKIDVRSGAVEN